MQKRMLKTPTKTGKIERRQIRTAITALHVMPKSGEGWVVRKIGAGRLTQQFPSKQDALEFGQSVAKQQKTNLIVHGRDGKIERIDSYGSNGVRPRNH